MLSLLLLEFTSGSSVETMTVCTMGPFGTAVMLVKMVTSTCRTSPGCIVGSDHVAPWAEEVVGDGSASTKLAMGSRLSMIVGVMGMVPMLLHVMCIGELFPIQPSGPQRSTATSKIPGVGTKAKSLPVTASPGKVILNEWLAGTSVWYGGAAGAVMV